MDPGAAAQPPFLLADRAEPGDRRAGCRSQCAPDAPARGQPARPVPRTRPPGAEAAAGQALRVRRMAGTAGGGRPPPPPLWGIIIPVPPPPPPAPPPPPPP